MCTGELRKSGATPGPVSRGIDAYALQGDAVSSTQTLNIDNGGDGQRAQIVWFRFLKLCTVSAFAMPYGNPTISIICIY